MTIRQLMAATAGIGLGFLWLPALPVILWFGLFLGPQANWRRNLWPVLTLTAAFYLPAPLCMVATRQSRWAPHLSWDHVAQEYLWASPCLPGILPAAPIAAVLNVYGTYPIFWVIIGVTTLIILSLFTCLARMKTAILIGLAVLAFCNSFVLSIIGPAVMRM